jgi:hypothetical protein
MKTKSDTFDDSLSIYKPPILNFTGIRELSDGLRSLSDMRIAHYKNGKLHRTDGPAVEWICDDGEGGEFKWYLLNGAFYK